MKKTRTRPVAGEALADLGVFHRDLHAVMFREALIWTCVWVGFAGLFNVWLAWAHGAERGLEFLTG